MCPSTHPVLCAALNRYQHGRGPGTQARNWSSPPCPAVIRLMLEREESRATHLAGGVGKAALPLPPHPVPLPSGTCAQSDRRQHLPFFRAWAMTSAALLLITLVTYRGQLVWLATVMERFTASASTCSRASKREKCTHTQSVP